MQRNNNLSPQTPLLPTKLRKTPTINKNRNKNIETIISEKLKGHVKIDTSDTFYESFLEMTYSVSSKLGNFNEKNGKKRSLETKIQLLENETQNQQNINKGLKDCTELKDDNLPNDVDGIFIELNLHKVKWLFFNISSSFLI